jgi:hypothetical protein
MSYNVGSAGTLQGSLPCYEAAPLPWKTGLRNEYKQGVAQWYNLLNNVPFDRNWGRSDVSVWSVGFPRPYRVLDATNLPQYYIEPLATDYRFLPYFDELPITSAQKPALATKLPRSGWLQ